DGAADAEGQDEYQRGDDYVESVYESGEYALPVVYDALLAGEELTAQAGDAAVVYVACEEGEQGADYGGGGGQQRAHHDVVGPAAGAEPLGYGDAFVHQLPSLFRLRKMLSTAFMSMMKRKSTRPMEKRA